MPKQAAKKAAAKKAPRKEPVKKAPTKKAPAKKAPAKKAPAKGKKVDLTPLANLAMANAGINPNDAIVKDKKADNTQLSDANTVSINGTKIKVPLHFESRLHEIHYGAILEAAQKEQDSQGKGEGKMPSSFSTRHERDHWKAIKASEKKTKTKHNGNEKTEEEIPEEEIFFGEEEIDEENTGSLQDEYEL